MLRKALVLATLTCATALGLSAPAFAATTAEEPKDVHWSFQGPFGKFDQAQLQRGLKIYTEVCSACHSLKHMAYRNLGEPGGPFWSEKYPDANQNPYVKAYAAQFQVADIDSETGDAITRPAAPADRFKAPFANDEAARASNGGALPPDLTVIVKAREGGAAYVYSLLTGYHAAPPGLTVPPGQSYNPYMAGDLSSYWSGTADKTPVGGFIAMPEQLTPDRVSFDDGTKSTPENEAKDVVAFLAWASDPHQMQRKQMGFEVLIYLFLLAGIVYASYRRLWRKVEH